LPTALSGQTYLVVNAAAPKANQKDFRRLRVNISDHLVDHGAYDSLFQPCVSRRGRPDGLEIRREGGWRGRLGDGHDLGGFMGGDLAFDLCHSRERLVPACLPFPGHQPIARLDGSYLPEGTIGGVSRRLEIAVEGDERRSGI
jgi:hypothetical protein